jgi:hypothetical protein
MFREQRDSITRGQQLDAKLPENNKKNAINQPCRSYACFSDSLARVYADIDIHTQENHTSLRFILLSFMRK